MSKRLQVELPTTWRSIDGPREDYPHRFVREISDKYGVLDVGVAEYTSGVIPSPSDEDLVNFAKHTNPINKLVGTEYGDCTLGKYGTARFSSEEFQYIQRWFLSNGKDFIVAEYHNYVMPEDIEVQELQQIVRSMDLVDVPKQRPKWKLW